MSISDCRPVRLERPFEKYHDNSWSSRMQTLRRVSKI